MTAPASIPVDVAIFVAAGALSLWTSTVLVRRIVRLGQRLSMTEALLGLVAALAADAPEIAVAVTASSRGQGSVGVGVVLGSNIFNLAALLGLGAVVAGFVRFHRRPVVLEGAVAIWVGLLAGAVVMGWLPAAAGLALAAAVMVPVAVVSGLPHRRVRRLPVLGPWLDVALAEIAEEMVGFEQPGPATARDGLQALAALVVVVAASVVMEQTGTRIGTHFSIPPLVFGATVLAAVTSIPNAVAAVHLASRRRGSALFSEALNSNSLNVVVGLFVPAAVLGLGAGGGGMHAVALWYVASMAACLVAAWVGKGLSRVAGLSIIGGYLAFVGVLAALGR